MKIVHRLLIVPDALDVLDVELGMESPAFYLNPLLNLTRTPPPSGSQGMETCWRTRGHRAAQPVGLGMVEGLAEELVEDDEGGGRREMT